MVKLYQYIKTPNDKQLGQMEGKYSEQLENSSMYIILPIDNCAFN